IPTFAEAVELCKDELIGAYIEIKDDAAIHSVIETLREQRVTGHSIVGSFRPDWLMAVKAEYPRIATSVMFNAPDLDPVLLARSVQADFVHPCWERLPHPSALLTPDWVARVREADLGIICWHEERPEQIAALRRAGVDGICSDAPELLT
ncbi:MAG: glycerophosphodiester phosphodiesterase, partial [Anaerolineae bacterium]